MRARVEQTYHCDVAAVLPHSDEIMTLASAGIFVLRYPDHPITAALKQVAAKVGSVKLAMSPDELFTRDEALGGLPARRAATLLFLIESRSAHFEARSRFVAEELPTEKAAHELDLAFLEAFALSREPPLRVTIQDLERHAAKWAHLIPENARVCGRQ